MTRTKGQSEILGLMMVVVLISVALLFIIGYLALSSKTSRETLDPQVAIYLQHAMYQTTTDCNDLKVWQLMSYCGLDETAPQPMCAVQNADPESACDHATSIIQTMLDGTLGKWSEHYIYQIDLVSAEDRRSLKIINKYFSTGINNELKCNDKDDRTASTMTLQNDDRTLIESVLYICK